VDTKNADGFGEVETGRIKFDSISGLIVVHEELETGRGRRTRAVSRNESTAVVGICCASRFYKEESSFSETGNVIVEILVGLGLPTTSDGSKVDMGKLWGDIMGQKPTEK